MGGTDSVTESGSVVISIDAELGWGFHDLDSRPRDRLDRSRAGWEALSALLDEYAIPATWAVVGHLLLDSCDGRHTRHPVGDEWFAWEHAQCSELRFAGDLVDLVIDSPVEHELCCHSFSHVLFGDSNTSRAVAAAELERCVELFGDAGLDLSSFVFPRNSVGHRDLLAEFGLKAYRGEGQPTESAPLWATRSLLGTREPSLPKPTVDEHGLVNIPASQYLYCFEGIYHRIAERTVGDPVVARARLGIDAAADADGLFHMWLHPNNLTSPLQRRRLERVLQYLDQRREDVRIETMEGVAERVRTGHENATPDQAEVQL